jgi:neutral ceramidase
MPEPVWIIISLRRAAILGGWLLGLGVLAGCCLTSSSPTGPPPPGGATTPSVGPLRAGAATVPVVLPNAPSLAGFGGPPRRALDASMLSTAGPLSPTGCLDFDPSTAAVFFAPATGSADPITARALVLDNGARTLAIVKIDIAGMSRRLRDALVATAAPLGIPAAQLALVATHTHSGPGGVSDLPVWELTASDCFSPAVFEAVKSAAVLALSQAHAALQPAHLGIGAVDVPDVSRRRGGSTAPPDMQLGLIKVTTAANAPLAALFNFAIHGTWYGANTSALSADVMGAMERAVEQQLPGVVAIFTNGAEGDVTPDKSKNATIAIAGDRIAAAVTALWTGTTTGGTVDLRAVFMDVAMPPPQYNPLGCVPLAETSLTLCSLSPGGTPATLPIMPSWVSTTLPVQALRVNDAVLVALPGEPVTDLGTEIKAYAGAAGLAHGFVVAVANDHGGYFTTPAQYALPSYEGTATLYGPTTGATIVDSAKHAIDLVK